jgi:hypothetical protein
VVDFVASTRPPRSLIDGNYRSEYPEPQYDWAHLFTIPWMSEALRLGRNPTDRMKFSAFMHDGDLHVSAEISAIHISAG